MSVVPEWLQLQLQFASVHSPWASGSEDRRDQEDGHAPCMLVTHRVASAVQVRGARMTCLHSLASLQTQPHRPSSS